MYLLKVLLGHYYHTKMQITANIIEHIPCTRHFAYINPFHLHSKAGRLISVLFHLTDKEAMAQRDQLTCPSHTAYNKFY